MLTDVEGLYRDWPDRTLADRPARSPPRSSSELLPALDAGMIPKMEACLRAVAGGVPRATVIDGRLPHSLLLEIFTDDGIGTMVRARPSGADLATPDRARLQPRAGDVTGRRTPALPRPLRRGADEHLRPARSGCSSAARAATSGTPTAPATSTCSAGIAVNALGHAHPPWSRPSPAQLADARPRLQLLRHPGPGRARRAAAGASLGAADGSRCSSPTPAPRRTRRRSRSPGGPAVPRIVAAEGAFHGRTMGALA